jgi:carbonic anhydrase
MDSRLDVFAALGLGDGEAHVLRNAGGVITDDVIRSLAVSQRRLGTREVMLIHHTDCGMSKLTDDGFRSELEQATGVAPAFAIESFTDVDANVRQSVLRVRRSAFLPHRDAVRGFVYDVDSHSLREIEVPAES